MAVAVRMAVEVKLLPWCIEDTDQGIAACLNRWAASRRGRPDLSGEMLSAVEQIRGILAANLHGRFVHQHVDEKTGRLAYATPAEPAKRDIFGYVKDGRILVEPTAWRRVLCAGSDPEKIARHLREEGILHADTAGNKLQRQEKVLRGESVVKGRFYALDMRILDDGAGTGPKDPSS
jgi:hypothetical protein